MEKRILRFYNGEPDGRLCISINGHHILQISTNAIDPLIDALKKHCSSEGDCGLFEIDLDSGHIEER